MGLRQFCIRSNEVDAAAGEVGKHATGTKYYHDRMKAGYWHQKPTGSANFKYKLSSVESVRLKIQ